jgi:hypothetical protein
MLTRSGADQDDFCGGQGGGETLLMMQSLSFGVPALLHPDPREPQTIESSTKLLASCVNIDVVI